MPRRSKKFPGLPDNTTVEVVATKGKQAVKKEMTLGQAKLMPKKRGWYYRTFQLGFSQFKEQYDGKKN